jgi:D-glycero-alpha-D-manno-heptose-7-phosphate kinase
MVISRTPFRISFFGGGTDYPTWFQRHGGAVLAATIDKYCYLTCRSLPPFFDHRYRIVYSRIESCRTVDEIKHPVVRAVLGRLGVTSGVEIHHDADLPARSGMGSSSAFTVGLLHAMHALGGRMSGRRELAAESIDIEQHVIRENVGSQDQVQAAFGGLNHIAFLPNGDFSVRPVTIPAGRMAELGAHLMLLFTGISRTASDVAGSYVQQLDETKRRQLRMCKDLVEEGIAILQGEGDLRGFGELLDEAWQAKRSLSDRVSSPEIDAMYDTARRAGAIGGKLTGAGGGGFLLLFVPPERQARVRQTLPSLLHVPFRFEFSGSQIIFFTPDVVYEEAAAPPTVQPVTLAV